MAPCWGNGLPFPWPHDSRSEAGVKGSPREPRRGRRPLTHAGRSGGDVFSTHYAIPAISGDSGPRLGG
jgi:hypothetical protein